MKLERFEPRGRGPLALQPSAFGGLFMVMEKPPAIERRGDVAIVNVRGPLEHHAGGWCDSYDATKARVLEALAGKPKALVLAIDSPGGLVSGCLDTAIEIRNACSAANVPLHTFVDGLMASAGYGLGCVAQSITVPSAGIVGSIGVIDALVDETKALAAMGVSVELVTSGERKGDGNSAAPITDGARAAVKARVTELAGVFFEHVAACRAGKTNVDAIRGLEAGLFTGAAAVRAGLADRVGSLDDLVAMLAAGTDAPRAHGGSMDEEEKKARAALQAIVDDEKSDDKAKARAKAALAAMDDEGDDDESKAASDDDSSKDKGDEEAKAKAAASARAAAAVAPVAKSHASIEARLASIEAELETERKAAMFAARPDVGAETRKALAHLPSAQVKSILDTIPKREVKPAASAVVGSTRGASASGVPQGGHPQGGASAAPTSDTDAMDIAMGRASVSSTGVIRSADGRSITLGADVVVLPKKGA